MFQSILAAYSVRSVLPLLLVFVSNNLFTLGIPHWYGAEYSFVPSILGKAAPVVQVVPKIAAIWAVEGR